jgi:glycosyltransferase involved in cell wall biosynthesis
MVALNEAGAIGKVVGDLKRMVPEAEIVVVDSSTDRTGEIAEQLGCRVIRQIPPAGYGPAMHEGLTAAGGEIVVTLDCDDTYPIESIPLLVSKIDDGFDLVNASRMKGKPAAMSLPNYLANWTFAWTAGWLCGVKTTDVHSGMRAYRRTMLEKLPYDPAGMALPVELLVACNRLGFKCAEVFIDYRLRIGATTLRPVEGTFWTVRRLWKWRRFLK